MSDHAAVVIEVVILPCEMSLFCVLLLEMKLSLTMV